LRKSLPSILEFFRGQLSVAIGIRVFETGEATDLVGVGARAVMYVSAALAGLM
jgi:hypothetical protein